MPVYEKPPRANFFSLTRPELRHLGPDLAGFVSFYGIDARYGTAWEWLPASYPVDK